MPSENIFETGRSYNNVYFLKIDASGHSNVVLNNPSDIADKIFGLFEESVYSTIEENKKWNQCEYAGFWGWQGDGGLCVFYDSRESVSSKTAISSSLNLIDFKLAWLQEKLKELGVNGEFHIRISIHKGSFLYKGDEKRGSIHSKELNFVSHLEVVTPRDSLSISEDVYRACTKDLCDKFTELDFPFENHRVYLYSNQTLAKKSVQWMSNISIDNSFKANVFSKRLSEQNKSIIIKSAKTEVIDLGTALSTCSRYLVTTQRPSYYRNEVLRLLDAGVNYTCLALNPQCEIRKIYEKERNENLKDKTDWSLERLKSFAEEVKNKKGKFNVLLYSRMPYFAAILIDRDKDGLSIFAPYMPKHESLNIERADSIHMLISLSQNQELFSQIVSCVDDLINDKETIKLI